MTDERTDVSYYDKRKFHIEQLDKSRNVSYILVKNPFVVSGTREKQSLFISTEVSSNVNFARDLFKVSALKLQCKS